MTPMISFVAPFPFTDKSTQKRRTALVLSQADVFNNKAGHAVLAMVTSAKNYDWPLDIEISDLDSADLPSPSLVRMKLFTLDHALILRKAGVLSNSDKRAVNEASGELFGLN